eukprot:m.1197183 g.1197183  ORF g.1197183 m.1197183 type:complete len:66 (-) comp24565_c0_seq11:70-267(-)
MMLCVSYATKHVINPNPPYRVKLNNMGDTAPVIAYCLCTRRAIVHTSTCFFSRPNYNIFGHDILA